MTREQISKAVAALTVVLGIVAIDALQAAYALRESMVAALDGAELAQDNPGGMIACFAESVAHAIRAAQEVGVDVNSRAAQSWAKFAGTIGTMCMYSTDATMSSGGSE